MRCESKRAIPDSLRMLFQTKYKQNFYFYSREEQKKKKKKVAFLTLTFSILKNKTPCGF